MLINGLLFGLISTLHCAGMCGPLAMMIPSKVKHNAFLFALNYQIGRIAVYIGVGSIVFAVGMSFSLFRMQQGLSVVLGSFMVLFALFALFKVPTPQLVDKPYKKIVSRFGFYLSKGSSSSAFILGALNGLLPCGAIYIAAVYCATFTNAFDAVAYMALFGIGTLPVFIGAWLFVSNKLSLKLRPFRVVYKLLPLLVGALMILRGVDLGIPYLSPELSQDTQKTEVKNCCKH
jgi:sulfite exporter TauE/SafE